MTPIERAVAAVEPLLSWDADGQPTIDIVRAVIAAIREPSEGMDDAMRREGYAQGWEDSPNWDAAWRAGIDALLAEGK